MSHYKPYPAYKDSGVEWLGKVPEHWEVRPMKWLIERNDGGVWGDEPDGQDDTIVLRSTEQTVDGEWRMEDPAYRKLSQSDKEFSLLKEGDLLVTKSSGSSLHIGKTSLVTAEIEAMQCCYSNFMQRIRLKATFLPRLAWFIMNNDLARSQFDYLSSTTTGLANLNGSMIGSLHVAIPPLEEQQAVLRHLVRETARIDALVAKKTRLIELLREKRQAIITHAVTKGLDPNVKLKDSGVEWLGEVPEHWVVGSLRYVLSDIFNGISAEQVLESDSTVQVTRIETISKGVIDLSKVGHIESKHATDKAKLQKGDVCFSNINSLPMIGNCARFNGEELLYGGMNLLVLRPVAEVDSHWFYWLISSPWFRRIVETLAKPAINQASIAQGVLAGILVTKPTFTEQESIVAYLNRETARADNLISKTERSIELLKERRSALITAAVTGQIDLREIA